MPLYIIDQYLFPHNLVKYLNNWCNRFHLKLQDIQPGEFRFDTLDLSPLEKNILNSKTEEDIRSRLCLLKGVNSMIYSNVVSMINFDSRQGISLELSMNKDLLTTSWKFELLHSILDATVEKNDDNPTVTISLNPVENVYKEKKLVNFKFIFQAGKSYKNMNIIFNMHFLNEKTNIVKCISGER